MRKPKKEIQLTSYDELLGINEAEQNTLNQIVEVPLNELHPFRNHPFHVNDDEKMAETVESIKNYGILNPALVRPRAEGGYELIAGHRRKRGCELAGKSKMPVLIRNYTDDEAVIVMVDSNIQRESLLPSEKAYAYKMKMDAVKHQGIKDENAASVDSADLVGQAAGDSGRTVQRYIRLTCLIPELLKLLDEGKINFTVGVSLTYLSETEQIWVKDCIVSGASSVTGSMATKLKQYSGEGKLTELAVQLILNEKKTDVSSEYFETQDIRVILNTDSINPIPGYAYLSVYNYQDWIPVQWGKIKDQQVTFDKMGKDIVYLPTYYVKGKSIPAGQPFWLKSDGTLQSLSANGEKGQVVIRNFAGQVPFNENRKNLTSLKGGELWGMKNGKKDKLLYTITDTLQIQHQLFRIDDPMSYRFVRLYLPSPGIALGELSFYSADKLITGIQILSPLPHNNEDEKPEMLIDGLSDTAFSGEVSKGYIDFDLNNEYKLSAIGISPYIRSWLGKSNTYELSYWENEWRTIERKEGNGSYLIFNNVPRKALLRLSHCSKNTQEHHRIFLYEDGKIIWL